MGETPRRADVLVIGGGIVGASVAYHLVRDGRAGEVVVVEPDPTYARASTSFANGGIRQLFSLPENIQMGRFGLQFYAHFAETMAVGGDRADISFHRGGYLMVSDAGGHAAMQANHRTQVSLGVNAELLDRAALKVRFPSLRTDDVALAVHSPDDAWIDPAAALQGFRRKARALGAIFVNDKMTAWQGDGRKATTATLASGKTIAADAFVLAAGAWSGEVAALIGLKLPVEPLSRETYFFRAAAKDIEPLPFVKTERHLGFRPEGTGYIGGAPDWSRPSGWNFELSPGHFEDNVWPLLAHRVPAFETLKLERAWAGHYERNTLDETAVVGGWTGGLPNVYIAAGFSGHGIMHAPAAGRAIAELILDGGFKTLDLASFGYRRIVEGRHYRETGIL
jgi:glycine/D-amino acid oxidase-like deaminating enzyme